MELPINRELRVLMLEDTASDAELSARELHKAEIVFTSMRVETRDDFIRACDEFRPDIILSDYNLPNFNGMEALEIVQRDHPEVPVVMVTGALSDIKAVELIHAGAKDYVLKDRLARLAPAVQRALSAEQSARARRAAELALRESLARYTAVAESANDAIIGLRPNGEIHLWNNMAQQMFGFSAEEAIGRQLHQLIVPERYRSEADKGMNSFVQTGTGPIVGKALELTAMRRDGTEFPIELSISAMNINGEWHATGIIRDITERKRFEEEIRRWNTELEMRVAQRTEELETSRAKLEQAYEELKTTQSQLFQQEKMASIGQLAAGVAHEINNPMGFIKSNLGTLHGYADSLQQYMQAEDAMLAGNADMHARLNELRASLDLPYILKDLVPVITESQEGAERVRTIVQNLKSFSRIDETDMQQVNLNECLDSTVNIAWNELKYKAVVIREYDATPALVECHPQQINQVFLNLLINAAQAMETKGVIRLGTRSEGEEVIITIADSGMGIKPEIIGRIFDPFFTTKPVGQGTGLGLSICYDIVKKHGGSILASSTPGSGTTFTIRLPIKGYSDDTQGAAIS